MNLARGSCARNKTIHLIRHAEGWHNVDELEAEAAELWKAHPQGSLRAEYGIAWMLMKEVSGDKYLDPLLTPKGREQAYALRTKLRKPWVDHAFVADAIALSPMRRAIETALLGLRSSRRLRPRCDLTIRELDSNCSRAGAVCVRLAS